MIEQWMSSRNLSEKLQKEFMKDEPYKWQEIQHIDIENNFLNFPKDLKRNIKRELCLKQKKKVQDLKKLDEAILDDLCDCLKLVYYNERACIVREGHAIDEMFFVVQGKLRIYTSESVSTRSLKTSHHNRKNHHLKDGDLCGEELVAWFQADPYFSNFPISTRTIQALTDVEAFVLMANDLQTMFIKHQSVHFIQSYWRFQRIWRLKKNAQINLQRINATNTVGGA